MDKGKSKRKFSPLQTDGELDLGGFEQPPEDLGLSLDELSGSLEKLISKGNDPYDAGEPVDSAEDLISDTRSADDCPVTPQSILEAMLFVGHPSDDPLTSAHVASLMRGVRAAEIDQMVAELNRTYQEQRCPYFIESVGKGYRFALRDAYAQVREAFYGKVRETRLSQAAIDVMALVAYHQPIDKETVEELRHEPSGRLLNQLVRRELLRLERTDETPRRSFYRTTDRFLELFGLQSLDDLPQTKDFDRR